MKHMDAAGAIALGLAAVFAMPLSVAAATTGRFGVPVSVGAIRLTVGAPTVDGAALVVTVRAENRSAARATKPVLALFCAGSRVGGRQDPAATWRSGDPIAARATTSGSARLRLPDGGRCAKPAVLRAGSAAASVDFAVPGRLIDVLNARVTGGGGIAALPQAAVAPACTSSLAGLRTALEVYRALHGAPPPDMATLAASGLVRLEDAVVQGNTVAGKGWLVRYDPGPPPSFSGCAS